MIKEVMNDNVDVYLYKLKLWIDKKLDDVELYKLLKGFVCYVFNRYKFNTKEFLYDVIDDCVVYIYCKLKNNEYINLVNMLSVEKYFKDKVSEFKKICEELNCKYDDKKSLKWNIKKNFNNVSYKEIMDRYNIEEYKLDIRTYIYTNIRGYYSLFVSKEKRVCFMDDIDNEYDIDNGYDIESNSGCNEIDLIKSVLKFEFYMDDEKINYFFDMVYNKNVKRNKFFNRYDILYYLYKIKVRLREGY